jgi:hypothetical protein
MKEKKGVAGEGCTCLPASHQLLLLPPATLLLLLLLLQLLVLVLVLLLLLLLWLRHYDVCVLADTWNSEVNSFDPYYTHQM